MKCTLMLTLHENVLKTFTEAMSATIITHEKYEKKR